MSHSSFFGTSTQTSLPFTRGLSISEDRTGFTFSLSDPPYATVNLLGKGARGILVIKFKSRGGLKCTPRLLGELLDFSSTSSSIPDFSGLM